MSKEFIFPVQVYYEDTDFSGVVYHANYLKFCERAREHALGVNILVDLYRQEGIGFAVYKAELTYHEAAVFGEQLEVRSTVSRASEYRLVFKQDIYRPQGTKPLVKGVIELVCLENNQKMIRIPSSIEPLLS